MSHKIKIQRTRNLNSSAKAITFDRPEDFDFSPGQHVMMSLDKGENRPFTMTSSPLNKRFLEFGIKKVGEFTSRIHELDQGDGIEILGPVGTFIFDEEIKDNLVFIAGGSGITPFICMMRYIEDKNLKNRIDLIYSVRKPEDVMFLGEIERMKENHIITKVIFTVTGGDPDWEGEKGRVSEKLIKKHIRDLDNKVYFVCGPREFEKSVSEILRNLHIRRKRVKSAAWG